MRTWNVGNLWAGAHRSPSTSTTAVVPGYNARTTCFTYTNFSSGSPVVVTVGPAWAAVVRSGHPPGRGAASSLSIPDRQTDPLLEHRVIRCAPSNRLPPSGSRDELRTRKARYRLDGVDRVVQVHHVDHEQIDTRCGVGGQKLTQHP